MNYLTLNAVFLAVVAVIGVFAVLRVRPKFPWAAVPLTLGVVLVMTAVFDNVMIAVGLVGYDRALISGLFVGIAPIEDFAYAIAAVVGLPSLWILLANPRPVPEKHKTGIWAPRRVSAAGSPSQPARAEGGASASGASGTDDPSGRGAAGNGISGNGAAGNGASGGGGRQADPR